MKKLILFTILLLYSTFALGASMEETIKARLAYQRYCAACHGREGRGDGPAAKGLPQTPPDLTDPRHLIYFTDEDLFNLIKTGRIDRRPGDTPGSRRPLLTRPVLHPPTGVVTDEEIRDVIRHLRSLYGR